MTEQRHFWPVIALLDSIISDLLNEEQHQWVFIHHNLMSLASLFWAKVAEVRLSTTSREEQKHSYYEKTLVEEELIDTDSNITAKLNSR